MIKDAPCLIRIRFAPHAKTDDVLATDGAVDNAPAFDVLKPDFFIDMGHFLIHFDYSFVPALGVTAPPFLSTALGRAPGHL